MAVTATPPDRPLVIWHPGATPPPGYIKANGAAISRTAYAWLFGKIDTTFGVGDGATTFNVPDLRGEFLRGLDDGRGIDTGRVLGSLQADEIKNHSHQVDSGNTRTIQGGGLGLSTPGSATTSATGSTGATETRPRNVAGLFCIAYAP